MIGLPQDFRQISSIIDVDILPETHRRVRLHKHGTHKPLGFYIRDGVSMRVTPQGVEKVTRWQKRNLMNMISFTQTSPDQIHWSPESFYLKCIVL